MGVGLVTDGRLLTLTGLEGAGRELLGTQERTQSQRDHSHGRPAITGTSKQFPVRDKRSNRGVLTRRKPGRGDSSPGTHDLKASRVKSARDSPDSSDPKYYEHQEQDEEHGRKKLRDCERCAGDSSKAEHRCNHTDYKERQGPTKHGDLHKADCLIRRNAFERLTIDTANCMPPSPAHP